jgi:hypothetical protein
VAAVGDEIAREPFLYSTSDTGERDGYATFAFGKTTAITMHDVRWVADATVDGTARWGGGTVTAHLVVRAKGLTVRLTATWQPGGRLARAHVGGRAGGRTLLASMPAP